MYLFSKEYFLKSLKHLSTTEEQIKTLALYIKTFKHEYKNIIEVWEYVYTSSNIHHKLVLLYLVNDVLQTDKSYDSESLEMKNSFRSFIAVNFNKTKAESKKHPPLYKKYCDLESVWESRNVVLLDKSFNKEEFFIEVDSCNGNRKAIIEVLNRYLEKLRKEEEYLSDN